MLAGVDGSSRGWVMVVCDDRLRNPEASFIERLAQLPRGLRVAAVDVPIGLPEQGRRDADNLTRKALGQPRGRSVFSCPIRPVLGARTWEEACSQTERVDGRRVSKQTFGILGKIAEADALIRTEAWARRIVREVHREVSFAEWAGAPMKYRKKSPAGREERQKLIAAVFGRGAFERAQESIRGHYIASDDVADAFAAAWTAARIIDRRAERLPEARQVDAAGVPMHIWA